MWADRHISRRAPVGKILVKAGSWIPVVTPALIAGSPAVVKMLRGECLGGAEDGSLLAMHSRDWSTSLERPSTPLQGGWVGGASKGVKVGEALVLVDFE